jgi:hypothetical protein
MRMMATLVGVVLAATAACGGNGNGDETASGRAIEPEAKERAESIVLKLADFPTGWRASAAEANESGQDKFNECIGTDYSELTRIGEAESQEFAKESAEANSDVAIFEDDQQAEDAVSEYTDGLSGTTAEDCFQDLVEEAVQEEGNDEDVKLGEVDVGELSFTAPENVDEAKAWQVEIPVEITSGVGEGFEPSVYIEVVTLREGDTVAFLRTQDVLTEFDRALRDKLAQTLADRMSESST